MERETGIEPATNSLEGCDSTTELLPPCKPAARYQFSAQLQRLDSVIAAGRLISIFRWLLYQHSRHNQSCHACRSSDENASKPINQTAESMASPNPNRNQGRHRPQNIPVALPCGATQSPVRDGRQDAVKDDNRQPREPQYLQGMHDYTRINLEPMTRIELVTSPLPRECSTN
jgi:hypothetical protein